MIRILDDRTQKFLEFLNENYGTEEECILSVFNCQDCIGLDAEGHTEQSIFIADADLIMLTTENPQVIIDSAGEVVDNTFYIENYTLIKLAHEYGHFLQKYGHLPNPEDLEEYEREADRFAQKTVKEFIGTESK